MRCSQCAGPVTPVVAFDVDGTLADYHGAFTEFCANYFGRAMPPALAYSGHQDFEDFLGLTRIEYRGAKLAYRQGGNKRWMPAYPDATEAVRRIKDAGADVWIATTRPWDRLDNVDPDTREWLRRNAVPFDGLLYGDDKYHQLAGAIDVGRCLGVVDDLASQYDLAEQLGFEPYQVARPHNRATGQRRDRSAELWAIAETIEANIKEWSRVNGC